MYENQIAAQCSSMQLNTIQIAQINYYAKLDQILQNINSHTHLPIDNTLNEIVVL